MAIKSKHSTSKKDVHSLLKAACLRNKNKKLLQRDDHFTMEDVDQVLKERDALKNERLLSSFPKAQKAVIEMPKEKRVFKAASLSDILGFNPQKVVASSSQLASGEVPAKWKCYYDKLIQLRVQLQKQISSLVQIKTGKTDEELSQNLLVSSDREETLKEVEAAIERILNGTYGVCEITGKPILEKRLESIPYTRYSLEGQEQMEASRRSRQLAQLANTSMHIADEESDPAGHYYETDADA